MMNDELELKIGRWLDGRLDKAQSAEVEALLESSEEARKVRAELDSIQLALRSELPPKVPTNLRDSILEHVATRRVESQVVSNILPFVRRLAAAAAVLLVGGLLAVGSASLGEGNRVSADAASHERSVEDEIRSRTTPDGDLKEYLAWHFLRRQQR